jgi:hypothetical protein
LNPSSLSDFFNDGESVAECGTVKRPACLMMHAVDGIERRESDQMFESSGSAHGLRRRWIDEMEEEIFGLLQWPCLAMAET